MSRTPAPQQAEEVKESMNETTSTHNKDKVASGSHIIQLLVLPLGESQAGSLPGRKPKNESVNIQP